MSRVGKVPVTVPADVKASVDSGIVRIEGKHGKLSYTLGEGMTVVIDAGKLTVKPVSNDERFKATYGTTRAILNSMVHGVSKGWKRTLELNGVGYTARVQGQKLVLAVGFSHEVEFDIPAGLKCVVNKNVIDMESPDRGLLGTFAAKVRIVQPPEPYLGKGIKYSDETVRRKAGKTGKK